MSHLFGDIRQCAFVVPDIDQAMAYWAHTLGIGPFFDKRKLVLDNFTYRGLAQTSPCISIALTNSGRIQIELIQQHDQADSIYKEFLASNRQGLQHVSSWVTRDEFDKRRSALLKQGYTLAQEGTIPASGVRLAYFDTERHNTGLIFEMADLDEPLHQQRLMNIEKAAAAWDGKQHVIEVGI